MASVQNKGAENLYTDKRKDSSFPIWMDFYIETWSISNQLAWTQKQNLSLNKPTTNFLKLNKQTGCESKKFWLFLEMDNSTFK